MAFSVRLVDETQLPRTVHWAMVREGVDNFTFIAKRDHLTPLVLAEAWAAFWLAASEPAPSLRLIAVH